MVLSSKRNGTANCRTCQGGFTQLGDTSQWDLSQDKSHTVGQATAIGISAGGISAAQLTQLKERLTQTQTTLQAVQANPQNASTLLQNLTGEQLSGDLLTATLWSWFAAQEGHQRLSQSTAGVISHPGLSYGLFHAVAEPIYSFGIARQVKFPGVNMDIGHLRYVTWAKTTTAKSGSTTTGSEADTHIAHVTLIALNQADKPTD